MHQQQTPIGELISAVNNDGWGLDYIQTKSSPRWKTVNSKKRLCRQVINCSLACCPCQWQQHNFTLTTTRTSIRECKRIGQAGAWFRFGCSVFRYPGSPVSGSVLPSIFAVSCSITVPSPDNSQQYTTKTPQYVAFKLMILAIASCQSCLLPLQ